MSNLMASESTPLLGNKESHSSHAGAESPVGKELFNDYILRISRNDDHISRIVKRFTILIISVILLYLTSFILVLLQTIYENEAPSRRLSPLDWPLFFPMWLGSALGIVGVTYLSLSICHNATLASRDRRSTISQALSSSDRNYIDFDSLPLLRRLLGYLLTAMISLVLCLVTQVLYYLWFIHSYLSVWHAVIPTFVLLLMYTAYMCVMSVFDMWSCCTFALLVFQLPLFTLQVDGSFDLSKQILLAPFVLGVSSCLVYYVTVLFRLILGRLVASTQQWICLCLYILSLICMIIPAILSSTLLTACDVFLFAVPIFIVALVLVLFTQGMHLAETRGYTRPIALMQDVEGSWVPAMRGDALQVWLLGSMTQNSTEEDKDISMGGMVS